VKFQTFRPQKSSERNVGSLWRFRLQNVLNERYQQRNFRAETRNPRRNFRSS